MNENSLLHKTLDWESHTVEAKGTNITDVSAVQIIK